ncbi:MAG: hypothetical protein JW808_08795 [Victivallales bacterium]|nr:hypothetical protein [Victivallales bacterium]
MRTLSSALSLYAATTCPAADKFWDEDPVVPQWRGVAPGTDYLGSDVLWRPREWLIFHMLDEEGAGFTLDFTVRDMNVYMQGPRPSMFWVVGPRDEVLAMEMLEDDGVVTGDESCRDGIYDIWHDYRYREWHRVHSPGGYPAGKRRSPLLENPQVLPHRRISLTVPAAGAGLYRVLVVASWDHWISVTPSRPLATGIHPGPGPLYIVANRFATTYLYMPPGVKDIGLSLVEEIQPYNWAARLENLAGDKLHETVPRTFMSYFIHRPERNDEGTVLRLCLTGETTGAHLHVVGLPFVLCPDPETAARIAGGLQIDNKGRWTFLHGQRVINEWADGIKPNELALHAGSKGEINHKAFDDAEMSKLISEAPALLATQCLDATASDYGVFSEDAALVKLAKVAGCEHPANPYHGDPGLIRRVALGLRPLFNSQTPFLWHLRTHDWPIDIEVRDGEFFSLPVRVAWHWDARSVNKLSGPIIAMGDVLSYALSKDLTDTWRKLLVLRENSVLNMHVGEVANQWTYALCDALQSWKFTANPEVPFMLRRHLDILLTPGLMGRLNPDPTNYRSALGYGDRPADIGLVGAGYLSESLGYDIQYSAWSQEGNLNQLRDYADGALLDSFIDGYNRLKSHVSLPRKGVATKDRFRDIASPTDFCFRTQQHAMLGALTPDMGPFWPALSSEPFVRVLDNAFFFINTPDYYAVSYGGHAQSDFEFFQLTRIVDGSVEVNGYIESEGRGIRGRKSAKPGGLSAVFVRNCGPTLLGFNRDVMYSNTTWGRLLKPACLAGGNLDPHIFCCGFVDQEVSFDPEARVMRRRGAMRHAPLAFTRTVRFLDDRIEAAVDIRASENIALGGLFESLPFMVDGLTVRLFDAELAETASFAADSLPSSALPLEDGTWRLPSIRAFDLSAPSGAGALLVFDRAYDMILCESFRFRAEAAAARSLTLVLPNVLSAGSELKIRYTIKPHQEHLSAETLVMGTKDLYP